MGHHVFISHSTKDKLTADAICEALESNGLRCWIAPRDIPPGKDWSAAIVNGIRETRVVVLVFSASANASHPVKSEIERAYGNQIPVIPFRIEDLVPSESLEFFLSTRQWLNAFTAPLEQHLHTLIEAVHGSIQDSEQTGIVEKIREAVVERNAQTGSIIQEFGSVIGSSSSDTKHKGERRQATILNAGIINSTSFYECLDTEEAVELLSKCLTELARAVYEFGGNVDKTSGESITAVFGVPTATENDAERAARAALSMMDNLKAFNLEWSKKTGVTAELQIGVSTGEVITGASRSSSPLGFAVLGEAVNVAASLQDAADVGQILVEHKTARLTAGFFSFQEGAPIKVKGKPLGLPSYELQHAKTQPTKTRGLEGTNSEYVGREKERRKLQKAFSMLKSGSGQIVSIIGEAGAGKSRLISEASKSNGSDITWLEGHCFAFSRALSYGPFLDLLRRFAQIRDDDSESEVRDLLVDRLGKIFPEESRQFAVFAQLLSIKLETEEAKVVRRLTGEMFQKEFFSVMEEFLRTLAEEKPVLILLEDMHWADQSSMKLVAELCSLPESEPIGIVALFRSRYDAAENWEMFTPAIEPCRDRYTELTLQPLSEEASRDLIDQILDYSDIPEKFYDIVIQKTGGNPFFVEELLRSLMEEKVLVNDGGNWKVTELKKADQVPDTLQGLLLSRLDRLPEQTKEIVQSASVIGRVFLYRILKHMTQKEGDIDPHVNIIEDANLVQEQSRFPEIEYIFRHALTQEVAYKTMLLPERKRLHRKVGEAMEDKFAGRHQQFTGLLAYHYFLGEAWDKALAFSKQAGDTATALYAFPESREHYGRALDCLEHLPDTQVSRQARIGLILSKVAVSLQAVAPEDNLALLAKAEELAKEEEDRLLTARVHLWVGRVYYLAGKTREAIGYFKQVLPVASESKDPDLLTLPGAVIGRAMFMQGHFGKCQQLLEQSIPLLEAAGNHGELLFAFVYRGAARTALGDFTEGSADIAKALKLARASRNQNAETMAHTALAIIKLIAGIYPEAITHARDALSVAEKSGDAMFRYSSNAFMAWGLTGKGDPKKAQKYWEASQEAAQHLGGLLLLGDWLTAIRAETLCELKDWDASAEMAHKAVAMAKTTGSVIAEGIAERILGRIHAGKLEWQEGNAHLEKSAELLESIGAKFDLARTCMHQANAAIMQKDPDLARKFANRTIEVASACGLRKEEKAAYALLETL